MRYICDPRKRRVTEHEIWEDVLRAFATHKDIEFAYPTQRSSTARRRRMIHLVRLRSWMLYWISSTTTDLSRKIHADYPLFHLRT